MKNIFIIDDDSTNNYLCELIIKSIIPEALIKSFTNPVHALASISTSSIEQNTIILLDLNMPEMSGWQFLEKFKAKKKICSVFILTSSINEKRNENAFKYPFIKGFIAKPFSIEKMKYIFDTFSKN